MASDRPKLRVVGYVRVSTVAQADNGVSIDLQREKIYAYADLVGMEVVAIYAESKSAKNMDRPKLAEALDAVFRGDADGFAVYAIDRFSRSVVDFLGTVEKLNKAGKEFISVREQMDSTTPHGKFTMTIICAQAQMERELIKLRTKEAMNLLFREGRAPGRVPHGYDSRRGKLIVNEAEHRVVRYIVKMRRDGASYGTIADRLNEMGYKTKRGRKWHRSTVRSVEFTAKKYSGRGK